MEENQDNKPKDESPKPETPHNPEPEKSEAEKKSSEDKAVKLIDLLKAIFSGYGEGGTDKAQTFAKRIINQYLQQEAKKFACLNNYNILILFDKGSLVKGDADNIYNAITSFTDNKPILLVLFSGGGSAGSAYLIGKLCREYSKGEFTVSIPRYAKSAATLLCCAANEIHMGSLSELGPIDPQIDDLPALGLKNSIEHLAELAKKYPESSDMFAKYLHLSLNLVNIGYYERVAESAMQYSERLLETHEALLPKKPKEIAFDLVYKYKDHGFVIDKEEAEQIFGDKIIKSNTEEYDLGNAIYKALEMIQGFFGNLGYNFYHIGSLYTQSDITKKR